MRLLFAIALVVVALPLVRPAWSAPRRLTYEEKTVRHEAQ